MKWLTLKELVVKDFAVTVLGVLYTVIKVIDKITKEETKDIRFYKVKTKNHHVRLLVDNPLGDPCILIKPRGLFKEWGIMEKKDVPNCLVENIFDESCSKEKRRRLISKMMGLKAFW